MVYRLSIPSGNTTAISHRARLRINLIRPFDDAQALQMQSGVSGSQRARPRLIYPALYRITAAGNNPSKHGGGALEEEQTRSVEASVFCGMQFDLLAVDLRGR